MTDLVGAKAQKKRYYVGIKKDGTKKVFWSTEAQAQQDRRDGVYRSIIGAFSSSVQAKFIAERQ